MHRVALDLACDACFIAVKLEFSWGGTRHPIELGEVCEGEHTFELLIPDIREKTEMNITVLSQDVEFHAMELEWSPAKHWEVCFVPSTHHDFAYTETIEELYETYHQYYDDVLRFCDETSGFPEAARYRYTVEQTWSLLPYLKNSPREKVDKFMQYAKEGRIEVSATFANVIDVYCGHEELHRLLYPSFGLRSQYGIPVTTACMVDMPGLSWGLISTLANAGINYLFAGFPTYFEWEGGEVPSFWDENAIIQPGRPGAFRWEGPDGASVLTYYCAGYGWFFSTNPTTEELVNLPERFEDVLDILPGHLEEMERTGNPFSVVRYIDHGTDNRPPYGTISAIAKEWNEQFAYPQLTVATNRMFFERLERECADVPVFRGELPHTDYTVGAAGAAKESAMSRNTHDRLQSAEHMAAMNALLTPGKHPSAKIGQAYIDTMLYDEHCFGMWQPLGKTHDWNWSQKANYAYRAAAVSQNILIQNAEHIAAKIDYGASEYNITVFNTLTFSRSEIVHVHNFPHHDKEFALIDPGSDAAIPVQLSVIEHPDLPVHHASGRYAMGHVQKDTNGVPLKNMLYTLVFKAEHLPALGYKTFRLSVKGTRAETTAAPAANSIDSMPWQLENEFYAIGLSEKTGAVTSIIDKEAGVELVDQAEEYGLNQLIVRSAVDGSRELASSARLLRRSGGEVYQSIAVTNQMPGCPKVAQEIILYHHIKKIEFHNRILKDETPFQEVYLAFPFRVDEPRFRFEATNSVIEAFKDQLPGSNTNYHSVQHWAEVSNDRLRILFSPLDAHILQFGGMWPLRVSQAHHGIAPPGYEKPFVQLADIAKGHLYSLATNSNFRTNFAPTQQGDVIFRYSLTSDRQGGMQSPHRFGWSSCIPPVSVCVEAGKSPGNLPTNYRLLHVEPDHVFLLTLKYAEDGDGLILRFMETEGKAADAVVELPAMPYKAIYLANNVEENKKLWQSGGDRLAFPVTPYQTVTFRIQLEAGAIEDAAIPFHERLSNNRAVFLP